MQQVNETVQNADNTTGKYDGTSKPLGYMVEDEAGYILRYQYFMSVILALCYQFFCCNTDVFVFGTGEDTAAEYDKTLTKTFHRIEETSAMEQDNGEHTRILSRVKNTISDRCITNKALDD